MILWKRLQYLLPWRRRAAERDMQEELRSIAAMADPRELGNLTLAAENARDEWGWRRLDETGRDIRYALRTLRRSPAFAVTAVLSLALGIGANTALFTLINAVAWRMLPVSDPASLVALAQQDRTSIDNGFTYQQYRLIGGQDAGMSLAAYSRVPLNVSIDGSLEPTVEGQLVSGTYFSVLGVRAARGQLLTPDDDRVPRGHPVAVVSYAYWKGRFAGDPEIVGRQVSLSGVPFTIVGVAPPEFFGIELGTAPKLFVPLMMQPVVMPVTENLLDRPALYSTWLRVIGRLQPGISIAQAGARLQRVANAAAEWRPPNKRTGEKEDVSLVLTSAATGLSDLRRQFSLPLLIVLAVVVLVLLIGCANTANLVLARSAARRPEFSLRLALGAGRSRLIRQVLIEGLVLAGLAGACGVGLAFWATRALVAYVSAGRAPIVLDLSPDLRVLAFTAAISMLAGLIFGSAPAIRAARLDMTPAGRQDLSGARGALAGPRVGRTLVVSQIALSLVLLAGAGLFLRSLRNLDAQGTAADRTRVLIVRVEPRGSDQRGIPGTTERLDRIYRDLIARVDRIAGIQSATLARTSPLAPLSYATRVSTPGRPESSVQVLMTYPRYFATMGIPIVQGRDFDERDLGPDSPLAVVVNQAFVREILDGQQPLGVQHGLTIGRGTNAQGIARRERLNIVGVVQDTRYPDLRKPPSPMMYQTFLQTRTGRGQMVLHARVTRYSDEVVRQVRGAVQAIDPDVPMFEIHTLADEIDAALVRERLIATLSGFFGVVALVLVCVGLYGVMAFSVSRRTAEIGIRVALGATRADVRWLIARQTLLLVLLGISIGLPAAWAVGRLTSAQISGMLFELAPTDGLTMASAAAVLVAVGLCAGLLPARRAMRIDPVVALRSE